MRLLRLLRPSLRMLSFIIIALIVTLEFVRAPLQRSFWLDELVLMSLLKLPLLDSFKAALDVQAQSPLYFLILRGWLAVWGTTEFAARSLSILFVVLAVLSIARIAHLQGLKGIMTWVILPAISFEELLMAAASARPYALAFLCVMLATEALLWWQRSGTYSWFLTYLGLLLLTFYANYIFLAVVPLHIILFQHVGGSLRDLKRSYLIFLILLVLLLLPGIWHLALFSRQSSLSLKLPPPSLTDVMYSMLPRQVLVYGICAFFVAVIVGRLDLRPVAWREVGLWTSWWIAPSLMLGALSIASGQSIFAQRYFLWRVLGGALIIGSLAKNAMPRAARILFGATWAFLVVFLEGQRQWVIEDWASAAAMVSEVYDQVPPVLCPGLNEARDLKWLQDPLHAQIAAAPLSWYGVPEPILVRAFPEPQVAAEDKEFLSLIKQHPRVVLVELVNSQDASGKVCNNMREVFKSYHYEAIARHILGLVQVTYLERN